MERLVKFFATGFGLGLSPVASGTFGALPGVAIAVGLAGVGKLLQAVIALVLSVIAVPLCSKAETYYGRKDDGRIVADEYLTFAICVIGIPFMEWPAFLAVAFIVSRVLDILKPSPARESQALASGVGIVMDDVLANLYALVINHLIWHFAIVRFVLTTG